MENIGILCFMIRMLQNLQSVEVSLVCSTKSQSQFEKGAFNADIFIRLGTIEFCGGSPSSTTGSSGTALFKLNAVDAGATIDVSKGRWEGCVRAARAVCPTGTFSSTCVGGASTGNVAFTLDAQ
jgi:hypothetical protein